jgi:hypothetical protein
MKKFEPIGAAHSGRARIHFFVSRSFIRPFLRLVPGTSVDSHPIASAATVIPNDASRLPRRAVADNRERDAVHLSRRPRLSIGVFARPPMIFFDQKK